MIARNRTSDAPILLFRLHNYNAVSLGAILGACSDELLQKCRIKFWRSDEPFPTELLHSRLLLLYSFMMPHEESVAQEVEKTRELFYREKTAFTFLAGGSQASILPHHMIDLGFDHVIAGEAEEAFPRFLEKWLMGNPLDIITSIKPGGINLDQFPGFHEIAGYLPPIEITRGCKYRCSYCCVPGLQEGTIRHRSIEAIVGIVRRYFEIKPARKRIKFLSPNAFSYGSTNGVKPNLSAIKGLLVALKEAGVPEIKFGAFPAEVRPDFVTEEVLDLIKPYVSNKTIVVGFQTCNDQLLKKMHRGHTCEQGVSAIKLLRSYGFTPHVDFIIGLPGETRQNQDELLTFMEDLVQHYSVRIHMHTFMPIPGSSWKDYLAEAISENARKRLRKLAQRGVLDGWWENQIAYSRKKK